MGDRKYTYLGILAKLSCRRKAFIAASAKSRHSGQSLLPDLRASWPADASSDG
jgi:hypothetical protein